MVLASKHGKVILRKEAYRFAALSKKYQEQWKESFLNIIIVFEARDSACLA
jgi:hypothetical protein